MSGQKFFLTKEQLDALAQSLLPTMQKFFALERGKKIWEDISKKLSDLRKTRLNIYLKFLQQNENLTI